MYKFLLCIVCGFLVLNITSCITVNVILATDEAMYESIKKSAGDSEYNFIYFDGNPISNSQLWTSK